MRVRWVLGAISLCFPLSNAWAQDEAMEEQDSSFGEDGETSGEATEEEASDEGESSAANDGSVSFSMVLDVTNAYIYRGIAQEQEGVAVQPGVDVNFNLFKGSSGLSSLDLGLGIWNSLHFGGDTGTGGEARDPRPWYECDFYPSLWATFADVVGFGVTYYWYTSPNGTFTSSEAIELGLSYDDSGLWNSDTFGGLAPSLAVAIETTGQGDGGENEGKFLSFDLEPSFSFGDDEFWVDISVPLGIGLSLGDYYENPETGEDDTFGYFDGGLVVGIPLSFVSDQYGAWGLSTNVHFMLPGDTNKAIGEFDGLVVYGGGGLSFDY